MIKVPVNKDFEAFEETVYAGMTVRQLFVVIPAIILDAILIYVMYLYININITLLVYIAVTPVIGIVLLACRKKEGMTLFSYYRCKRKGKALKQVYYQSTETPDLILDKGIHEINEEDEWMKTMKIIKICAIAGVIMVLGIVSLCIIYLR